MNHTRVGIKSGNTEPIFELRDPSFAHNVFEYHPNETVWNTMEATANNESVLHEQRRRFYDVPPRPQPGGPKIDPTTAGIRELYWLSENLHFLCVEDAPLQWYGESQAWKHTWALRGGTSPTLFQRGWNQTIGSMQEGWSRARRNIPRPQVDKRYFFQPPGFDYGPPRFEPASEAGWLRTFRRRRDRRKRQRLQAEKRGVSSLGDTFRP